jgi:hypothetical protein
MVSKLLIFMNNLLTALLLALAVAAHAQTTNITALRITTVTNGVTDQVNITLSAREAEGFLLNYAKDVQTALQLTNPVPTLQTSIKATVNSLLLNPLSEQARANDRKTNLVDLLFLNLPALWDTVLTSQQRSDIKAIANATNVTAVINP